MIQKFCTECGKTLFAGNTFCGECGAPVTQGVPSPEVNRPAAVTTPQAPAAAGSERVAGIIPFVELSTGFTSSESGTFIVTDRRIIFARTPAAFDQQMAEEGQRIWKGVQEAQEGGWGTGIAEQLKYLNARDWSTGPWKRYASMHPDMIASESPGNLVFLYAEIGSANFLNASRGSVSDNVDILAQGKKFEFELHYAQGPASLALFHQFLGDRAKDLMATWGTVDTIATLLGGKRH